MTPAATEVDRRPVRYKVLATGEEVFDGHHRSCAIYRHGRVVERDRTGLEVRREYPPTHHNGIPVVGAYTILENGILQWSDGAILDVGRILDYWTSSGRLADVPEQVPLNLLDDEAERHWQRFYADLRENVRRAALADAGDKE